MSYPTGMGAGTGNHYQNVAAQMQAYVNGPSHRSVHAPQVHSAQVYSPQVHSAHVYSPQVHSSGHSYSPAYHHYATAPRTYGSPMIGPQVGEFARLFMRNLLS